ncbi:MAG TPA: TolC family protein [Telluria sp.]|nr:TolC family protein [Telluria sp.]
MKTMHRPACLAAALLLGGCASVSPDGGFGAAAGIASAHGAPAAQLARTEHDTQAISAQVTQQLKQPLGVDDAVRIAVVHNPAMQAQYWEAGIAEADLVQAGRLPNPRLEFQRTHGGGELAIERSLTLDLVRVLTMPLAQRIERGHVEQTQLELASAILKQAADTRRAWFEAVAARQAVEYAQQVQDAAEAAAELTGRMVKAGNSSALDLAQQEAFQAEAAAATLRSRQAAVAARERLARLMGVSGAEEAFTLPDRLPDLPATPAELADVERLALIGRVDLQAAKAQTAATAANLGLTRSTRFINVLDLGGVRNSDSGQPRQTGYAIALEVPLFDWGGARVARAEAIYMQSVQRYAAAAGDARSEAREAYQAYRSAYDAARHFRDRVIPLRKKISDETLLRYNGMLASVFDLIADARNQAAAVSAYIDAQRDFWVADTQLHAALGGKLPADAFKETKQ